MKNALTVIVLVVLAIAAWYFYSQPKDSAEEMAPPPVTQPAPEPAPATPQPAVPEGEPTGPALVEPEPQEPSLPALAESDVLAVASLEEMVGSEAVERSVAHEAVIPKFVASLDALGGRQVPAAIRVVEGPGGEFQATADERPESVIRNEDGDPIPQYIVDPVNYARYAPYVEMLEAMTPTEVAAAIEQFQPLLDEAFQQLGYAEGSFGQRLRAVIDELLATPDVEGPVRLIKPEAYYLYADKRLEALTAGQKILLRMGPDNAARVKARLAEIRDAL